MSVKIPVFWELTPSGCIERFLWNVCTFLPGDMASYPRQKCSLIYEDLEHFFTGIKMMSIQTSSITLCYGAASETNKLVEVGTWCVLSAVTSYTMTWIHISLQIMTCFGRLYWCKLLVILLSSMFSKNNQLVHIKCY